MLDIRFYFYSALIYVLYIILKFMLFLCTCIYIIKGWLVKRRVQGGGGDRGRRKRVKRNILEEAGTRVNYKPKNKLEKKLYIEVYKWLNSNSHELFFFILKKINF